MLDIDAIAARYKVLPFEKWIAHSLLTIWEVNAADYSIRFIPATIYGNNDFRAEAEFIAHARCDIPRLVSRVRDLEWELRQLKSRIVDENLVMYT